ncbi:MAG: hypothetical protein AAB074_21090 [Planctomycetota bacterium]
MIRFATFALFAALIAAPVFAQDAGEEGNRVEDDRKGDRALREQEAGGGAAGKAREPGGEALRAPRRPNPDSKQVPLPVVVPAPEMLTALPADGRVAPYGDGFALLESGASGDRLVAFDKDGKNPVELLNAGQKVERWWLSADGKRVLWVGGGKLFAATPGSKVSESLGESPLGAPSVSPDGARVAFIRGGKLVVRAFGGSEEKLIAPADGLLLGAAAAWAIDGKKVFTLVGATANEPDGIGAADLAGEAPSVVRVYQATSAILSSLSLSPTGRWLMFVQTAKAEPRQAALRLLAPDGSEFRTLARASAIDDPVFSPDNLHAYFSARGANGLWQAWEAGLEPDAASGEIPVRRIVEEENRQFVRPVVGRDANLGWFIREDASGKGAQIGKVKLR